MDLKILRKQLETRDFDVKEIMGCLLQLNDLEIRAYQALCEGPLTVAKASSKLKKSRPTTQRVLSSLVAKGLAIRRVAPLKKGGYVYIYHAIPKEKLRELLLDRLNHWYSKVADVISKIC